MNNDEIMNCAAILAAGVMANRCNIDAYNAESAVSLMKGIAAEIKKQESEDEAKNIEWF